MPSFMFYPKISSTNIWKSPFAMESSRKIAPQFPVSVKGLEPASISNNQQAQMAYFRKNICKVRK